MLFESTRVSVALESLPIYSPDSGGIRSIFDLKSVIDQESVSI